MIWWVRIVDVGLPLRRTFPVPPVEAIDLLMW
jgi:hypothetical protein